MRTNLLYGQALEAQRDRAGACEAYRSILARWGKASPRSVTAEAAAKRVQALGCARTPG
jgi:serine/threonine-protein kinase